MVNNLKVSFETSAPPITRRRKLWSRKDTMDWFLRPKSIDRVHMPNHITWQGFYQTFQPVNTGRRTPPTPLGESIRFRSPTTTAGHPYASRTPGTVGTDCLRPLLWQRTLRDWLENSYRWSRKHPCGTTTDYPAELVPVCPTTEIKLELCSQRISRCMESTPRCPLVGTE